MTQQGLRRSFDYRWLTLAVTTTGSFMSLLNMTSVNIALPTIMEVFGVDVQEGQWVITAYSIAMSIVIPMSGFLAEKVGMKRMYMLTMALFVLGSLMCVLAWNLPSLVFFRVLQGLGGGMLQPLNMAIVFSVVTPRERGQFMGLLGLPMLAAPLLGPTVGGYLIEYVDWRSIFAINLPIGLVGLTLAGLLLRETPSRPRAPLDVPGLALSTIAFPSLLLGFTFGAREGWGALGVQLVLMVGALAFIAWVIVELIQEEPMLDLRLFANPTYSLAMAINFVLNLSLHGTQFLLPLFLQTGQGLDALQAGIILVPQGIAGFLSMNIAGQAYNRLGPRPIALLGTALMVATTWSFSRIGLAASPALVTWLSVARGLSMGFCHLPVQTSAYNTVPQEKMPRATALNNGFMRIYATFSTAFLATILHGRSVFHYTHLAASMTPSRPAVAVVMARLQAAHGSQGLLPVRPGGSAWATPDPRTAAVLSRAASHQAFILAFNDTFVVLTLFSLAAMVLGLFLKDAALTGRAGEGQADPRLGTRD